MNKDLLAKAVFNDTAALSTLRRTLPPGLTVFVAPGGKLHINATLAAWEYFKLHQVEPDEWGDEPTLTFAQAFPAKVKRDPLKLKPVTPGLWTDLWEQEPEMVAAVHWGVRTRNINDSELELKGRVRRHLKAPDSFLQDVLRTMKRDERQAQAAMDAVSAPVEQAMTHAPIQRTPQQSGRMAALLSLEQEYKKGRIDIGRYLALKEDLEQGMTRNEWSHERFIALSNMLGSYFSLEEIRTLAFCIGLRADDLPRTLSAAARELPAWAKRRSKLDHLLEQVKEVNPARWSEFMNR